MQATALRKAMPASLMQSVIVETAEPLGYAVLRVLSPQPSFRPMATQFLAEADCGQMAWQ